MLCLNWQKLNAWTLKINKNGNDLMLIDVVPVTLMNHDLVFSVWYSILGTSKLGQVLFCTDLNNT